MFSATAPAYWAKNIPVIPLRPKAKIPAPQAWQAYAHEMPDADTQARWLDAYPDGNIGLPLGPQSGMLAIDLDSLDPKVLTILEKVMPVSLWRRVGKKGAVYMFKYNGERTTRIKHEDGSTVIEILSRGTQVVLPPSIHPDTGRAYEANCELLSVVDQLVALPRDFEMTLRKALTDGGIKLTTRGATKVADWVPAGGRDSALTSMAGLLSRSVLRGERTLLEALAEIEVWVAAFTEKVTGDIMDPEKGRSKVMEFLRRDLVGGKRALPKTWSAGMTPDEEKQAKLFLGEEIEEWSVAEILDDLTVQFSKVPMDNVVERGEIIEGALVRLAKSTSIDDVKQDIVLKFIQVANGRHINMSSLRKRRIALSQGDLEGKDQTEIALAVIKDVEQYGELRYQGGIFYQWRGAHWEDVPDGDLMAIIAKEFGHLVAAKKFNDHRGILQIIMNQVPHRLGDNGVIGINFANGYLTIDGELRSHDPSYGATYVLPYRYMPEGDAPQRWLGLLDQCWGHTPDYMGRVQALREAIACTLFKQAATFSRAFLLVGVPHSGKSTIKYVMEGLVPPDALCCVPPHDWADTFLPTQMQNKLVNSCGDLSETEMIAGGRFKMIVEGEEMNGQFKGGQIFKFRPLCAQWFASNHLPRTRDTSGGFNRRWLMWHFDKPCRIADKVTKLHDIILDEEREAIVAWAIPAMQDLMRNQDYTLPKCHNDLISEAASQNNSVRFFMVSGGVEIGQGTTPENDLYSSYYAFCKLRANAQPVALKKFTMTMSELAHEFGFERTVERVGAMEVANYVGVVPFSRKQAA